MQHENSIEMILLRVAGVSGDSFESNKGQGVARSGEAS